MRFDHPAFFFFKTEKQRILTAIQNAEKNTSGEIRVHLEHQVKGDILEHAWQVFARIGMDKTKDRNGVLIFLAIKSKRFAILGDKGIHEKVPENFWEDEAKLMEVYFKKGEFAEGIAQAILQIGEKLKTHFPYQSDDINELPDSVSC